jgi:ribosomal-protein-alanine N-acetyltransferase
MEQRSRRLRLVPATAESVEAEMADPARLGRLIDAEVPDDWPPETLREALPRYHQWHREHPEWTGWLEWYGVRLDLAAPVLCGSAGFHGPPDDRGMVEVGYSVLPAHRRRGLATEMVAALVLWARTQSAVCRVEAETTVDNPASIRVLEHVGFRLVGSSDQTGSVRYCLP